MSPSPIQSFTLTSQLGQDVGLGEGCLGSFPESYSDPRTLPLDPTRKLSVNVDVAYV